MSGPLILTLDCADQPGITARVTAFLEGVRPTGEVRTGAGFQAGGPAEVHLGLGAAKCVERLEVRWPSGKVQVLEDVAVDRLLTIREEAR